jgi:hypothetical protein
VSESGSVEDLCAELDAIPEGEDRAPLLMELLVH